LARKAIYKHLTQVNTISYPDDGTSPVGSNEWNEAPDPAGMLGFTAQTIASASSITPTNSTILLSGSTNVSTIAVAETNEYDLLYVVTSGSVTLVNTSSPSSSGDIKLLANANKDLSATIPTILIRIGTAWYEYGGSADTTPTDITVADESSDTTCFPLFVTAATGDLAPKSGSNLAFNSNTGILTATGFAGALTGNVTGDASGSSGSTTGNAATATALATGRTISATGEVTMTTGSFTGAANATGAATITDNIVDEANLKVSNGPTNGQFLSAQSGNTGGLTWAAAGGGGAWTSEGTDTTSGDGATEIEVTLDNAFDESKALLFITANFADTNSTGQDTLMRINGLTASNYSDTSVTARNGGSTAGGSHSGSDSWRIFDQIENDWQNFQAWLYITKDRSGNLVVNGRFQDTGSGSSYSSLGNMRYGALFYDVSVDEITSAKIFFGGSNVLKDKSTMSIWSLAKE